LRAGKWYNKDRPIGLAGFINDKKSRMIGYATLRQSRVKNSELRQFNFFLIQITLFLYFRFVQYRGCNEK